MATLRIRTLAALSGLAAIAFAFELLVAMAGPARSDSADDGRTSISSDDSSGVVTSIFLNGASLDRRNPFFKSLGTNGRSCGTCHVPGIDWTITPEYVQEVFKSTKGMDPLFAAVDGMNSPNADCSTPSARKAASSMLLTKGLIRVGIGIPQNAEFTLDSCDDPYGYASAAELSLFRRPLPTTNLGFLTTVMWDGRESTAPSTSPISALAPDADNRARLIADLRHQAADATLGHAQALAAPTDDQLTQIVGLELNTATAQRQSIGAGSLTAEEALGGPFSLLNQPFYVTINDVLGADHFGNAFNPSAMTLYRSWLNSPDPKRRQIARGEVLFNTKAISITQVAGLNDVLHLPVIHGFCTSCHDAPNVGDHSVALPINIGTSDASRRTPDMPLYTLRNIATGETTQTTDPGRAMVTGKWADIGKFKGPVLRGLAARAPYFHNGIAATLGDAVDFYDTRFGIGFTEQEKGDLIAFLESL